MHNLVETAIAAAAATPTITEDVARFPDGWTVTRHVLHLPGRPGVDPDGEPHRAATQTMFEIRDANGLPFDATSRLTIDPEA